MKLNPYEGSEPYIFVVYSHRDIEKVYPFIEGMEQRGYRLWYDLGIELGTKWRNTLARHAYDCTVFLVFLSRASAKSYQTQAEIYAALDKEKPICPIYLENDVELPPELEMYLRSFQGFRLTKYLGAEDFLDLMEKAEVFSPCKTSPLKQDSA